jgi:hypothetical protein
VFTVTNLISGSVRVTDNGTEMVGSGSSSVTSTYDYIVNDDKKTITFSVGRTAGHTIVVAYNYDVPINLTMKNQSSIDTIGIFSRKVTESTIKTMADARARGKKILSVYSTLTKNADIIIPYSYTHQPGESVRVVDAFNGVDEVLVVSKLKLSYPSGQKTLTIGTPPLDSFSWQKGIDARLKALEEKNNNTDLIQQFRSFNEEVNVKVNNARWRVWTSTVGASWIVGSSTNGLVGTNTGTYSSGQQVVGSSGRVETVVVVDSKDDSFLERFNFTTYIDTGATTAAVSTANENAVFDAGEVVISLAVRKGVGTITTATLTADNTTNLTFQMSADGGSHWENCTSGTLKTFTNTGTDLRWKATASGAATLNTITVSV